MNSRLPLPTDRLGRPIRDLRLSVTDRCNFRCVYCMPKELFGANHQFLPRRQLLSFEEITRLAAIFVGLGVRKFRITGGEPLVRKDIEVLVEELAGIDGVGDIALTTNGSLLTRAKARVLREAGLTRVNFSLDALDDRTFKAINHVDFSVGRVLEAIENAQAAGLGPLKVNMVVIKGLNEHSVLPMARYFHGTGHILRFIEYMDVGCSNGWRPDEVFSAAEIVETIARDLPLEPAGPEVPGEVARRWRYRDGGGEIGVIASVTQPFCRGCNRARISVEGMLYTCLFAQSGYDLRRLVRGELTDQDIHERVAAIWRGRGDRYSERRAELAGKRAKIEMSYIGG